jgi:hypothetical protein
LNFFVVVYTYVHAINTNIIEGDCNTSQQLECYNVVLDEIPTSSADGACSFRLTINGRIEIQRQQQQVLLLAATLQLLEQELES